MAATDIAYISLLSGCTPFFMPHLCLIFQVSFFSTSHDLSSEQRYPFFMRTIPSDLYQAEAMVRLVQLFNWTYVSVVYEESSYGQEVSTPARALQLLSVVWIHRVSLPSTTD